MRDSVATPVVVVTDATEHGLGGTPESTLADSLDLAKRKKVFPGMTQVLCDGLMVTSGATSWLWLTLCLLTLPIVIFLYFSLESYLRVLSGWLLLPVGLLWLFSIGSALVTAYTDPGILPRGVSPRAEIGLAAIAEYEGGIKSLPVYHGHHSETLMGKQVCLPDGRQYFVKYCATCEIFRPPRSSHCSFCDNCVEEFDHHCPWVSNCVGRRNYRYFMLFIIYAALLADYMLVLLSVLLHRLNTNGAWEVMAENVPVAVLAMLAGLIGLAVNGLVIYNLRLIATDRTTSESVKGYQSGTNRSGWENLCRIFCAKRPNRHVAWREYQGQQAAGFSCCA